MTCLWMFSSPYRHFLEGFMAKSSDNMLSHALQIDMGLR